MVDNKEVKVEFEFFGEAWTFLKKHWNENHTDEEWIAIVEESHEIGSKYNRELCNDVLLAILREFERRSKNA